MKKKWNLCVVLVLAMLCAGCGQKFEPTESTIFVTSKGVVKSAIMESFDKSYYDFDELYKSVEKEVKSYCLDKIEEVIKICIIFGCLIFHHKSHFIVSFC